MRFCLYLYEHEVLTERQALEVISVIVRETPPLGRLLLRERLVTVAQVGELLRDQPSANLPLGALAVKRGLVTEGDVQRLLALQIQLTPKDSDVVARLGLVGEPRLSALHHAFLREQ